MRSDLIHLAISKGNTRFDICRLVATGVRKTHRVGTRFEDSIGMALSLIGPTQRPVQTGHIAPRSRPQA